MDWNFDNCLLTSTVSSQTTNDIFFLEKYMTMMVRTQYSQFKNVPLSIRVLINLPDDELYQSDTYLLYSAMNLKILKSEI